MVTSVALAAEKPKASQRLSPPTRPSNPITSWESTTCRQGGAHGGRGGEGELGTEKQAQAGRRGTSKKASVTVAGLRPAQQAQQAQRDPSGHSRHRRTAAGPPQRSSPPSEG